MSAAPLIAAGLALSLLACAIGLAISAIWSEATDPVMQRLLTILYYGGLLLAVTGCGIALFRAATGSAA